ncbi:MAG: transcriptional initiation protein Tat [Phycisphaerales bacterium]|nr:transcriptional initiation protein Tat [Phycisphaerales bacterium]
MRLQIILVTGMAVVWCFSAVGLAADEVGVVGQPPSGGKAALYVSNREPLAPGALLKLPIGAVTPKGWLRHQLELEAAGMGGRLEEISPFLKYEGNGWVDPQGKGGWEELPYWIRGYGDLGYVLKDPKIIANARKWIDGILAGQQPDGWFGPLGLRKALDGRPDMWPHMPVLNALQSFYELTGDKRVLPFITRYAAWQNTLPPDYFSRSWQDTRFGDNIETLYWLYNRTGDKTLLELARKMHENSAKWSKGVANWHNVNFAQGFREPAEWWLQVKDAAFLKATEQNYQTAMGTYGQFPGGGFAADENARRGFDDPRQGFETCGMVEFMHSFEMLARITGNPLWLDRCEEIAFNSLPAALTPDLKALHYLTGANQVQLDKENKAPGIDNSGTMFSYSPNEVYRCCQHNHTMGWPYYAEELWHATADGGLAASLYCASEVQAKVAGGDEVKVVENTDYPFSDTVELKLALAKPVRFPLYLRVPRWCEHPSVKVNGREVRAEARPSSYIVLTRDWSDGDTITLKLPMNLSVRRWAKNKQSVSVDYGPLTFSLDIGQKWVKYGGKPEWPEQEVYPTTPYNYGLVLNDKNPAASFEMSRKPGPLADQPFTPEASPIRLKVNAKKIPNWGLDRHSLLRPLQPSPVRSDEPTEAVTLIPMGAARLRISSFPVISAAPDAHEWSVAPTASGPAGQATISASHVHDELEALNDGILPTSSADETIPRFTWWDHKGTAEWVEYDFKKPVKLSAVEVYWFDDTGHGFCRVPRSWKVLYMDGGKWKPVDAASAFGTKPDAFNRTPFAPIETSALRISVQLQDGFSGGILEWKVE